MRHRSNYNRMLFLTLPMAFVGVQTHDFVFTKLRLKPLDHSCFLYNTKPKNFAQFIYFAFLYMHTFDCFKSFNCLYDKP